MGEYARKSVPIMDECVSCGRRGNVTFLFRQESNQRTRHRRGATKMRPLLCTSPAASPSDTRKCPDFLASAR